MKKTDNQKPVYDYNKIIAVFSLIIAAASLGVAIFALNSITKVQGFESLLMKTSENAIELKKQNTLQQKSIDNNSVGINELKYQTKTLLDLQESNANQLDIQKSQDRSILIGDYLILKNIYWELSIMSTIPSNLPFFDQSLRKGTMQYLNDLKKIINSGMNTKLLKMNDKIYSQWWVFGNQIDYTLNTLYDTVSMVPLKKYYNIPISPNRFFNGKKINKKESDLNALIRFNGFFQTFWIKGVAPMSNIKEIQYYDARYLKLSNFGRNITE